MPISDNRSPIYPIECQLISYSIKSMLDQCDMTAYFQHFEGHQQTTQQIWRHFEFGRRLKGGCIFIMEGLCMILETFPIQYIMIHHSLSVSTWKSPQNGLQTNLKTEEVHYKGLFKRILYIYYKYRRVGTELSSMTVLLLRWNSSSLSQWEILLLTQHCDKLFQ